MNEWWLMSDEWWMMDDELWMMNDKWWMMNDEWMYLAKVPPKAGLTRSDLVPTNSFIAFGFADNYIFITETVNVIKVILFNEEDMSHL